MDNFIYNIFMKKAFIVKIIKAALFKVKLHLWDEN